RLRCRVPGRGGAARGVRPRGRRAGAIGGRPDPLHLHRPPPGLQLRRAPCAGVTMGLFSGLVTLPLAPVRGVAWVTGQAAEEVERQMYDPARVRAELLRLELDRESGLIGEEEYE